MSINSVILILAHVEGMRWSFISVLHVWAKKDVMSLLQSRPSQKIIPQVGIQYTGTGYCLATTAQQWPFSHSRPADDKDNNVLCSAVYCNHLTWLKGQEEFAKLNNTRWQLLLHFYLLIYRVIQKESVIQWEMIVCVILSKNFIWTWVRFWTVTEVW